MELILSASSSAEADQHRRVHLSLPADLTTPVRALSALRAAGRQPALLESVEGPARLAAWSFLAFDPDAELVAEGQRPGGPARLTTSSGTELLEGGTAAALRTARERFALPAGRADLAPFQGGWVGYLGYEEAAAFEPSLKFPEEDPLEAPRFAFRHCSKVAAFDHANQRIVLIASCPEGAAGRAAALADLERTAAVIEGESHPASQLELLDHEPIAAMEPERFERGVEHLRGEIGRGEVFQAVLSQRFSVGYRGDELALYRALRRTNPAPHLFFFEHAGTTLIGASPERLCSLRGHRAELLPIAGTRPRATDPARDSELRAELASSAKERAEHDMLVDLARNDLGRVARYGTVRVAEHAVVRGFARVQHLVSRVTANLAQGRDALDLLAACFPAGTVSGAPKLRAMQLVAELEGTRRGPYGGAFGYLDDCGDLDLAIVLRSFVARGDRIHLQAGAGIVFDSEPRAEREETLHKARALFEALEQCGQRASDAQLAEVSA